MLFTLRSHPALINVLGINRDRSKMSSGTTSESKTHLINVKCKTEEANCHLMPCSIDFNGDRAEISKYFTPCIDSSGDHIAASFRGRPLSGKEIILPKDYTGIVVQRCQESEDPKVTHSSTHQFKKFTYWNWDMEPSANDKVSQAMDWIEIANAIHCSTN